MRRESGGFALVLKSIGTLAVLLSLSLTAACAANLCERKERFGRTRCAGTDVSWHADPSCEAKIEHCDAAHLAQFEGYVACLESQNECSMEALARCQSAYPGGVNLSCPGT